MVSPSGLSRVAACLRSETLEHTHETSEASHLGVVAHRYLANCLTHGQDEALALEAPVDQEWLAGIDVARLPAFLPDQYAPEVSFAMDFTTGQARELGRGLSRQEARALAKPGEMVGTADVAGITEDAVVVHDYKTGWGYVDPPSINWQVLTYALMAARAYGRDAAVQGIIRARSDGFVWFDTAKADLFRLEQHEAEVRELLEKRERILEAAHAGAPLPPFNEGPHCRYCPARFRCPSKTEQLVALAHADREAIMVPGLTLESAPLLWEKIKVAEKMLERLKAEVQEFARINPVPLGGGWMLAERSVSTETIVPERARPIIEQAFPEVGKLVLGEAIETEEKLTKTALSKAMRKFVLPTLPKAEAKITKVVGALEERLRSAGAVSVRVNRRVDEHRAEKPMSEDPLLPPPADAEAA